MKKAVLFICILLTVVSVSHIWAYKLLYAEQLYELYHLQFYQYPEDLNECIFYLQKALEAPFANPLNALAVIENKTEWERYRTLFRMHVNIKLTELYRLLASKYDKRQAFFYNYPFRETNLKSLEMAEYYYNLALIYWEQSLSWAEKIDSSSFIHLTDVQFWEDEYFRITTGDLDYESFIKADLERLEGVRQDFLAMDDSTY